MAYAFTQDVPIDSAVYRRILEGLGPEVAAGLILHTAVELPGGGLRYLDVWESEADWNRFAEERLHPVVHPIISELLQTSEALPEPPRETVTVVDIWQGRGAARPLEATPAGS